MPSVCMGYTNLLRKILSRKEVFILINDPYIGMPINMGGRCDTTAKPPVQPPEASPQPPEQQPSQPTQPPQPPQPPQDGNQQKPDENASGFDARYLGSLPLAMAYTPMQQWKSTYSPQEGLSRGTIFPELDLPFEGRTVLSEGSQGRRMQ